MICWGCWGQRGKGDCSRQSATELGARPGDWIWRSRRTGVALCQPICCPGRSGPWISWVCLLQLGTGTKQQVEVGRMENLWDPQGMGLGSKEGYHRCSSSELGMKLGTHIHRALQMLLKVIWIQEKTQE